MNITIIYVGKIKEKYLKDAIKEYSKRLTRYAKITFKEVPDEKAPENLSDKDMEIIKEKEGQGILKHIKDNTHLITLDLAGKMMSSEELAKKIHTLGVTGKSNIAFVIGGSLGLSNEVLKRSNESLCISKMTFPHQLCQVILLEQVYRGFRINRGEPYHK